MPKVLLLLRCGGLEEESLVLPAAHGRPQVPHSQCSLRENPKFLLNFRSKNNTLKEKKFV
jgi:hypothetical protein